MQTGLATRSSVRLQRPAQVAQRVAVITKRTCQAQQPTRAHRLISRAEVEGDAATAFDAPSDVALPSSSGTTAEEPERVVLESTSSNVELAINLLLIPTLIYVPLSMAAIGRRLWFKYKFTNKRMVVINSSPAFKKQVEVLYKNIKEVRAVPRALGAWGDMVIFLKDGERLELVGVENYKEIKDFIERAIFTL